MEIFNARINSIQLDVMLIIYELGLFYVKKPTRIFDLPTLAVNLKTHLIEYLTDHKLSHSHWSLNDMLTKGQLQFFACLLYQKILKPQIDETVNSLLKYPDVRLICSHVISDFSMVVCFYI